MNIKICAVGDIMLGEGPYFLDRGIRYSINKKRLNPFNLVQHMLKGDLVFRNLELPLSRHNEDILLRSRTFRGDPEFAVLLSSAGFNVLNLANNHFLGQGYKAAIETYLILKDVGITPIGWKPNMKKNDMCSDIINIGSYRIGFIPLCDIPVLIGSKKVFYYPRLNSSIVTDNIVNMRKSCDVLIVSAHWGEEYVHHASPYLLRYAEEWISLGVDIVLGHGPHVIQGGLVSDNSVCQMSMGNFLFDQLFMEKTRVGGIFEIDWSERSSSLTYHPTRVDDRFQVYDLHDDEKKKWLREYYTLNNGIVGKELTQSRYDQLALSCYTAMQKENFEYIMRNLKSINLRSGMALCRDSYSRVSSLFNGLIHQQRITGE